MNERRGRDRGGVVRERERERETCLEGEFFSGTKFREEFVMRAHVARQLHLGRSLPTHWVKHKEKTSTWTGEGS